MACHPHPCELPAPSFHHHGHPSWLEIDARQFAQNLAIIKELAQAAKICLVVKANAYGHGIVEMGTLAQCYGVDVLGVVHLQEALLLRQAGVTLPIIVLGAIHEDQLPLLIESDCEISVSSHFKAQILHEACVRLGKKIRVHLEVDTGMHRTGMRPATTLELVRRLPELSSLIPSGIYSHFATADLPGHPATDQQLTAFKELLERPEVKSLPLVRHIANSAALLSQPTCRFDMVRPGLLAYGYNPFGSTMPVAVQPCLSLKAKVSYTKIVEAGAAISYGHRYVCERRTRIVTIPVGYGDGYPRAMSQGGSVLIRGRRFPIAGTICMDQFMVDVGEVDIRVGEEVVLLGKQGTESIGADEIARLCDTVSWDILSRFTARLPRLVQL